MNRLRQRDFLLWSLAVIVAILNAGIASYNIDSMVSTQQRVTHTRKVQIELISLQSALSEAQTGYRGYVMTGNKDFLAPYRRNRAFHNEHFMTLKSLCADNPAQQARLVTLGELIDDLFRQKDQGIIIRDQDGRDAAIAQVAKGHGNDLMNSIRKTIDEMLNEESGLLEIRKQQVEDQIRLARIATFAAAALAVIIILIAATQIRSELRRRIRANAALTQAKDELQSTYATVRESERRFRQLAEAMPQFVWMSRRDGQREYINARWYEYTGRTPDQSIGRGWDDALHEDDRDRSLARWEHSIRTGDPYEIEHRIRRHDGADRWFLSRAQPVRDEQGGIIRWLGTSTDIDDNKRLTETLDRTVQERTGKLNEQRAFLDAILNNVSEGIVARNAKGKLLFNRATKEMHGLEAEELPVEEWPEHYSLFESDGVTPIPPSRIPLNRAWQGEIVRDVEMVIQPENQPPRYVQVSGQPLINPDKQVIGAVVSMRDITERRQYEQALLESTQQLKASNEELEKFAYIASHDLQEPLRKIQAFGDRLLRKHRAVLEADGQESVDRMLDAAARMRRLIEDLLAFSRVSTQVQPFDEVKLDEVLADVVSTFQVRLETLGGTVTVGPLPSLPGDDTQLRQLFQNLIGNAIKFAKADVPLVINVTAVAFENLAADANPPAPGGTGWRISVQDNGIGFDQQYESRIFELFQRLHGRSQYEGTGLGLAICAKIALRHGFELRVRSQAGVGSTFIIDWVNRNA